MTKAKHTPGPWVETSLDGWDGVRPENSNLAVCKLVENNPENARLIAAAPDLLEAVRAAQDLVEWFMQHSRQADHAHSELGQKLEETDGWKAIVDSGYNGLMASYSGQFYDAIAKATGEAV